MKRYILIAGIPFLFACNPGKEKVKTFQDGVSKIELESQSKSDEKNFIVNSHDVVINEFLKAFNEISNDLSDIKAKEKIVTMSASGAELKQTVKTQIIGDIQLIYELLQKNKTKVNELNNKLSQSKTQSKELVNAVINLAVAVNEREEEIKDWHTLLGKSNTDFRNLQLQYEDLSKKSEQQTIEMNTGYYAVGTTEDLQKQGIVTQEGAFSGLGKKTELNALVAKKYLTKVDITLLAKIPLKAKKAELITNHPEGSYEFYQEDSIVKKLRILDPEKFWLVSKYLVISITK